MTAVASPLRREHQPARQAAKPKTRLEVVERTRAAGRGVHRARRRRLLVGSAAVVVVTCLLGLVASHVALAQGQFRLERLQQRAAEQQAHYERLRLQVAQLESPSRVVAAAQERLGMVPPPGVTYLSPTGAASGQRTQPAGGGSPGTGRETATDDWSSVKRQLARR